ncbi:hypothetical protein, partial [Mycoplasmopsis bovis]|uniref:hypothetical protein n=1 Tax=Mycoplasmopsis bovis TaxID=28903 RepID=UPI001C67FB59
MSNRINNRLIKSDTTGKWRSSTWMPTASMVGAYPATGNPSGFLQSEVDGSVTNEMQTLSIAGSVLSISGGNSVNLPTQTASITGGNRIQVTGTYPNFTISYIEPSINTVTR